MRFQRRNFVAEVQHRKLHRFFEPQLRSEGKVYGERENRHPCQIPGRKLELAGLKVCILNSGLNFSPVCDARRGVTVREEHDNRVGF